MLSWRNQSGVDELRPVTLMKENDPVGWRCALSDYESEEESEGNIISFDGGSPYFSIQSLEDFIEKEGA